MLKKYILIALFLPCSVVHGQMSLGTSTQINTDCDGFGCEYSGPSILINEVMIRPNSGNGSIAGSGTGQRAEWIELYNPDLCKPVDISCYFLGNCSPDGNPTQYYGGGFELPAGTIVPPRGFVIVRGVNASPVPASLLVQNGGRTVEVIVSNTSSSVCFGGGTRLWFPDNGGWFAFYDQDGVAQDAISWNSPNPLALAGVPCNPPAACPFVGILASYNAIPAARKNIIHSGLPTQGQSIRRIPDGGNWVLNSTAVATYGTCNTICVPAPVITCNGSATVSVIGGQPPYSYLWDDEQTQMTPTATGLCGGTYCVTVTDANLQTATACATVVDFKPLVELGNIPSMCIDEGSISLVVGSPPGGVYEGHGVSNGVFNPVLAGVGDHTITYTWYTVDSCENSDSTIVTIFPAPTVFLPPLPSLCAGIPPMPLSTGFPAGGTYSGTGVVGNTFDPSISGIGSFQIAYCLSNAFGCDDTAYANITVYPGPAVNLAPFPAVCLNGNPIALTGGTPAGGTYSGPGISANTFNPALTGTGTFTITYSVIDSYNCQGSNTQSIQVLNPPLVSLAPQNTICLNSPPVALSGGSPAGGTYSGTGVAAGLFDPSVSGAGTFTITYTYTDAQNCQGAASQTITVQELPAVSLANLPDACTNGLAFPLSGGSPPGGTYSGTGVAAGNFNPVIAGAGSFTITYAYKDANNCNNTATAQIAVFAPPLVNLDPLNPVCQNAPLLLLSGGTPVGGTFSGTAVTGGYFNPSLVAAGSHPITYTFIDTHGCQDQAVQNINVLPLPQMQFIAPPDVCLNSVPVPLAGGIPAGGTYSGPGVSGNTFDPAITGTGTFVLTYMYTATTTCSDTITQSIVVRPVPEVSLIALPDLCLNNPPGLLSGGTPAGGTYSGSGVTNGSFDPAASGAGQFPIVYTYIDTFLCSNSDTALLTVHSLPEVFEVMGGGLSCEGGGGDPVWLSGTEAGTEYRLLLNGSPIGFPFTGSGQVLDFGNQPLAGFYRIQALDPLTGCYRLMDDSVQIALMPRPAVFLGDTMYLCDLPMIQLDPGAAMDSLTYLWQDGSTERFFVVTEPGLYWVKVGLGSCFAGDSLLVFDCSGLEVPNVFSPNDDFKNDRFKPRLTGEILDFKVMVFNRWGKVVYESGDLEEGWDGTLFNQGQACAEGTYFYVITYQAYAYPQAPLSRKVSGTVSLLR